MTRGILPFLASLGARCSRSSSRPGFEPHYVMEQGAISTQHHGESTFQMRHGSRHVRTGSNRRISVAVLDGVFPGVDRSTRSINAQRLAHSMKAQLHLSAEIES